MASSFKKFAKGLGAGEHSAHPWWRRRTTLVATAAALAIGLVASAPNKSHDPVADNLKRFKLDPRIITATYIASEGVPVYETAGGNKVRATVPKGFKLWIRFGQRVMVGKDMWVGVVDGPQPHSLLGRAATTEWLDITAGLRRGNIEGAPANAHRPLKIDTVVFAADGQVHYLESQAKHLVDTDYVATSMLLSAESTDFVTHS